MFFLEDLVEHGATKKFVDNYDASKKLSTATGETQREHAEKDKQNEALLRLLIREALLLNESIEYHKRITMRSY